MRALTQLNLTRGSAGSAGSSNSARYVSAPVHVVQSLATTNIAVATGPTPIGGYSPSTDDEVVLTAQSTASENGPWVFKGPGVAMVRPAYFVNGATQQAFVGMSFIISNGTSAGQTWRITTTGAITIGSTSLTLVRTARSVDSADVTGTLPVSNGGTGLTASPTNGQLPIGNGSGYTLATLSSAMGLGVTNGAGSIAFSVPQDIVCVFAMSSTNENISSAPATIDSQSPPTNAVILLTAQTTGSENGFWIYNGTGSALTRPTWFATGTVIPRLHITAYVLNGSTGIRARLMTLAGSSFTIGTSTPGISISNVNLQNVLNTLAVANGGTGTVNRTLTDGSSVISVDWANRALVTSGGVGVLSWSSQILYDTGGNPVLSWNASQLVNDWIVTGALKFGALVGSAAVGQVQYDSTNRLRLYHPLANTGGTTTNTWQKIRLDTDVDTRYALDLRDHFTGGDTAGSLGWLSTINGAGSVTLSTTSNSLAHPGVITIASGGSTNDRAALSLGALRVGGGAIRKTWVFNLPAVNVNFALYLGLVNTVTAAPNTGVWLEANTGVNANWLLSRGNGTASSTASATAVATGWHIFTMDINAAGTSVTFTLDGTALGTLATPAVTDLPATTANLLPSAFIRRLSTGGGTVHVDAFELVQTLTTALG